MNELQRIIQAFARLRARGESAALATVVAVGGSTYRRPGARMLVSGDGEAVGSISGGCLERDVFRQAARVLHSGEPVVAVYDSTDDDIAEGYSLGCKGIVVVLVEPLSPEAAGPIDFLADCLNRRRTGVLATVFAVSGDPGARVGARLMLTEGQPIDSNGIGATSLCAQLVDEARRVLSAGRPLQSVIDTPGGRVEVFFELVKPSLSLAVFGAGHDAVPLVQFAKALGWHVGVVSRNAGHAMHRRFAAADQVLMSDAGPALDSLPDEGGIIAVTMSHNYFEDLRALRALLPRRPRYVAILGPKRRTARLLDELEAEGFAVRGDAASWLYGPAGLDIGADTPEEIALAIVAEIRAAVAGRSGGFAKHRHGPLHEPCGSAKPVIVAGLPHGEILCGLTPA
ncbi:XdhC family protein [Aromatoleum anaerobium]|nr:XdhC family protein [Aromatoleum anaerobium]MCK0508184.1 XdhC family protein [Aromatoleum anaerobium]